MNIQKSDIGLIGLAVMGANFARNIASRGFHVSVFNRTTSKTTDFINAFGTDALHGHEDLESFVQSLKAPRKIILLVQAGVAVDKTMESILPYIDKGDTIIDCGNSLYTDTIRREKEMRDRGFHFFGCGVSGGEEGALNGPSLMPGGSKQVWEGIRPMFEAAAATDFNGGKCVTYIGENGAGHFVKMVHNGIEYGVMQMMAEAYEILSKGFGLKPDAIADIFERFNKGKLESFLFEISVPILRQKDDLAEGFLLDKIMDKAGQKGTGRWTAIEGMERGVDISVIIQAVNARIVSSRKNFRIELGSLYKKSDQKVMPSEALDDVVHALENGLYAGMLVSYAQGFDLLRTAAEEQNWDLNYSEIARIWEGGCIIRAQILNTLHEAFEASNNAPLWKIDRIQKALDETYVDLKTTVHIGSQVDVPMFCLGAALSSFEAMTAARGSANFIQGLRDFFGAHTYERTDREGSFHTQWGSKT